MRLYLSSEFRVKSGRHKQDTRLIYQHRSKLDKHQTFVIDSDVLDAGEENVALTKNQFANYVFDRKNRFAHFQIDEFHKIFDALIQISMS
jgi:RNA-directed DNA polymerase